MPYQKKNITEATISEKPHLVPLLDLVIGENRTLEQALDAVRFINGQMNPSKKARLVYIEEGSTHLFIDGPEETLREIQELYRHGELQKLLADRETPGMLTILSAELIYDKKVLEKAALINEVMDMRVNKNELIGANLSGADLTGADLTGVDLRKADLNVADLSGANLSGANLSGANLSKANLSKANLSDADLNVADLSEGVFSGANLTKADFTKAMLVSSKFERNVGLTESQIIDMQSRGALFVDSPEFGVPSLLR